MPLDDNEQKILAEIERQFYEEDPELARAVRDIQHPSRLWMRLALFGVIAGLAVIVAFFTSSTLIAFAGFGLVVASATVLVNGLRGQAEESDEADSEQDLIE